MKEVAVRRAARVGDGWFMYPRQDPGDEAHAMISTYRQAAAEAGLDVIVISKDPLASSDTKICEGVMTVREAGDENDTEEELANNMNKIFLEVIIAPAFSEEAIKIFSSKTNLRLLKTDVTDNETIIKHRMVKDLYDGFLIQDKDNYSLNKNELKTVTSFSPSEENLQDMLFAAKVIKYVKSNAIVFVKNKVTIGIGAGQMSRIDAAYLASNKTKNVGNYDLKGSVVASDAFLPFPDTLEHIYKAGALALIQPGGSKKDSEIINLANNLNIAMVFSSIRNLVIVDFRFSQILIPSVGLLYLILYEITFNSSTFKKNIIGIMKKSFFIN